MLPTAPCDTPVCLDLLARYVASGNSSVDPCTDFFSLACGRATGDNNPFQDLAEENKSRLRRILGEESRLRQFCVQMIASKPRTVMTAPNAGVVQQVVDPSSVGFSRHCMGLLLYH